MLITIGACATAGGIQALRNGADVDEFVQIVYAHPGFISTLERSTPVADHVEVDFELRGCPIDRGQLLEVISAHLAGRPARIPTTSVCMECKARGNPCVMVAAGTPLPRAGHDGGLQRHLPRLRPGLLRLFRPDGEPEHRFAGRVVHAVGHE